MIVLVNLKDTLDKLSTHLLMYHDFMPDELTEIQKFAMFLEKNENARNWLQTLGISWPSPMDIFPKEENSEEEKAELFDKNIPVDFVKPTTETEDDLTFADDDSFNPAEFTREDFLRAEGLAFGEVSDAWDDYYDNNTPNGTPAASPTNNFEIQESEIPDTDEMVLSPEMLEDLKKAVPDKKWATFDQFNYSAGFTAIADHGEEQLIGKVEGKYIKKEPPRSYSYTSRDFDDDDEYYPGYYGYGYGVKPAEKPKNDYRTPSGGYNFIDDDYDTPATGWKQKEKSGSSHETFRVEPIGRMVGRSDAGRTDVPVGYNGNHSNSNSDDSDGVIGLDDKGNLVGYGDTIAINDWVTVVRVLPAIGTIPSLQNKEFAGQPVKVVGISPLYIDLEVNENKASLPYCTANYKRIFTKVEPPAQKTEVDTLDVCY